MRCVGLRTSSSSTKIWQRRSSAATRVGCRGWTGPAGFSPAPPSSTAARSLRPPRRLPSVGRLEDRDGVVQAIDHGEAAGGAPPARAQRGEAHVQARSIAAPSPLRIRSPSAGRSANSAAGKCQVTSAAVYRPSEAAASRRLTCAAGHGATRAAGPPGVLPRRASVTASRPSQSGPNRRRVESVHLGVLPYVYPCDRTSTGAAAAACWSHHCDGACNCPRYFPRKSSGRRSRSSASGWCRDFGDQGQRLRLIVATFRFVAWQWARDQVQGQG